MQRSNDASGAGETEYGRALQAPELLITVLACALSFGVVVVAVRRLIARRRRRRRIAEVIERSRRGRPLRPPSRYLRS